MKKADAIQRAGGKVSDLAELLGITDSAISQWGENIPQPREWQLRVLKPDWFTGQPAAPTDAAAEAPKS